MNYYPPKDYKPISYIKPFYKTAEEDRANNDWGGKPVENTDLGGHFVTISGSANASATGPYYTFVPSRGVIPEVEQEQQYVGHRLEEITFPKPKK
jgi:hypothetical protein